MRCGVTLRRPAPRGAAGVGGALLSAMTRMCLKLFRFISTKVMELLTVTARDRTAADDAVSGRIA